MSRKLERIRLVSERYWELQGLRHVLVGIVFSVVFGVVLLSGGPTPDWGFAGTVALAIGLIAAGMLWLDRYYERTLGRLRPTAASRRFGTFVVPVTLFALLWLHPLVGAPPFSLYFAGWAAFGLWITWRDWPFRAHHLVDTVAGTLAAALQWRGAGTPDERFLMGLVVIGVGAIVSGSLDHRLLTGFRPAAGDSPAGAEPQHS